MSWKHFDWLQLNFSKYIFLKFLENMKILKLRIHLSNTI